MTLNWRVEAWNLPHNSPHEIVVGDVTVVDVSFNDGLNTVGQGQIRIPASDPDLNTICDPANNVSTLLRVYMNDVFKYAFFAENRSRPIDNEDQPVVVVSGPGVKSMTEWGIIPTFDYPENPSSAPDWIYGGGATAGSFTNGDMESFGSDLLTNGGFESQTVEPWQSTSAFGGPGINLLEASSFRSESGSWSAFLDPLNAVGSGMRYADIPVEPGARYTVTIKILQPTTITPDGNRWTARIQMGTDGTVHHTNGFRVGDAAYAEIDNAVKGTGATILGGLAPNDNTVWQGFTLDVTMGASIETSYIEIAWESGDSGSPPIYVDTISMIQTSGDGLLPWQAFTPSTVTLAVETVIVHGGSRALRFTSNAFTAENFPTGVQQLVTGLTPGDPYTFNAWVYNPDVVTRSVDLRLRQQGAATISLTTLAIPAGQWMFGSVTAVAPLQNLLAEVRVNAAEEPNLPLDFIVDDTSFSGGLAAASPGQITLDVYNAIVARSFLDFLGTPTFTASLDSGGNAWADAALAMTVPRGQQLRHHLDTLASFGYEWDVTWTGTDWVIEVFNPLGLGTTVANIGLVEGDLIPAGSTQTTIAKRNSVFAEGSEGIFDDTTTDAGLITALGARETYVQSPDFNDQTSLISRAGQELLDVQKYVNAVRLTVDGNHDFIPFVDYSPGDTIQVELDDIAGAYRVNAVSVRLAEESRFDVEFNERTVDGPAAQAFAVNKLLASFQRQQTVGLGQTTESLPSTTQITVQGPWALVAAANAPQAWRDAAGYLCDGINDEVEIRAAIQSFADQSVWGTVLLSPGTFYCGVVGGGAVLSGRVIDLDPDITPAAGGGCRAVIGAGDAYEAESTPAMDDSHGLDASTQVLIDATGGATGGNLAPVRATNAVLRNLGISVVGLFTAAVELTVNAQLRDSSISTDRNVGVVGLVINPETLVERVSIASIKETFRFNTVQGTTFRKITVRGTPDLYVFNFAQTNGGNRSGAITFGVFDDIHVLGGGTDANSAIVRVTVANTQAFSRNFFDGIRLENTDWDAVFRVESPTTAFLKDNWIHGVVVPDRSATPLLAGADAQRAFRRHDIIDVPTASLPPAADMPNELRWDTTTGQLKFSDGTNWIVVGP